MADIQAWPKARQDAEALARRTNESIYIEDTPYGWHLTPAQRDGAVARCDPDGYFVHLP